MSSPTWQAHLSPSFLAQQSWFLDSGETGWTCFTREPLPPSIRHLLEYLIEDPIQVNLMEPGPFESLRGEKLRHIHDAHTPSKGWVRQVLTQAVSQGASDVHFEPRGEYLLIRFRLDGQLMEARRFDGEYRESVTSRLKVLADLDVAEKRRPQDGGFQLSVADRLLDFRLSVVPTGMGEKMVVRILDRDRMNLGLSDLGLPDAIKQRLSQAMRRPHGMVLVTGPTGSGKTTTLYAALGEIAHTQRNIMTIEDPIEYQLDGLNQAQVRPGIGFGFSQALRCFLRQDPNVIMVGEIRDEETALMAIRASLTGHLMLSTLHTNTAVGAISRLRNLGVADHLLAASLHLILGQRLVRLLCEACKQPNPDKTQVASRRFHAKGCHHCQHTGFLGRTGVFEALPIDSVVAQALSESATEQHLLDLAPAYFPMSSHGQTLLRLGLTSHAEIVREVDGFQ